jgi:hypothetical protein
MGAAQDRARYGPNVATVVLGVGVVVVARMVVLGVGVVVVARMVVLGVGVVVVARMVVLGAGVVPAIVVVGAGVVDGAAVVVRPPRPYLGGIVVGGPAGVCACATRVAEKLTIVGTANAPAISLLTKRRRLNGTLSSSSPMSPSAISHLQYFRARP